MGRSRKPPFEQSTTTLSLRPPSPTLISLVYQMSRLALLFALMAASVFCATSAAEDEDIEDMVHGMEAMMEVQGNVVGDISRVVEQTGGLIREAEEKMEQFIVKIDSLDLENSRITKDNFAKYNRVKEYLREARRQLRELATKTKSACEDLELFVSGWEDNKRENKREYFKEQIALMEELLKDTFTILGRAETQYERAITELEDVRTSLQNFKLEVNRMLESSSKENEVWKKTIRAVFYSGCVLGGIFSPACYAVAVPVIEIKIAKYEDELEELRLLGDSVKGDIEDMRSQTRDLIQVLKEEVNLIVEWRVRAKNMDKSISILELDRFDQLIQYRTRFTRAVEELRKAAEAYLEQPETLDEIDQLWGRKRKRRAPPLTRSHKRSF